MLVRFATLAFLLFGCSSPTGVVAANNIVADVVGGVQEDHGIDGFARKVNSPTAAAAGASASHGVGHQHARVLKEGKGNHRQAMKNDEGRRSLGLFDSKSTKVAPDEMDLDFMWAARNAFRRGDYAKALRYALLAMKSGAGNNGSTRVPLLQAALTGYIAEKAGEAYLVSSMDDDDKDAKKKYREVELELIFKEVSKTCKSVTETIDSVIDDEKKFQYLLTKGDCSHATLVLGLLAGLSLENNLLSTALMEAEDNYKSAYVRECIDSSLPEEGACVVRAVAYARFLYFVGKEVEAATIVLAEFVKLNLSFGLVLTEGKGHQLFDNLSQVIDDATCNHYATFDTNPPCDDLCLASPYATESLDQGEGEKGCCTAAYLLACDMVNDIKEDIGEGNDIEVQVTLDNELNNDGEVVSTTMSELHLKVVTYYADNTFVPGDVVAPPSEQVVLDIASNSIDSITSTLSIPPITLEGDYDYEFSNCQESPLHSNTMIVSLVGKNPLIDPTKVYLVAGADGSGGANGDSGSGLEDELVAQPPLGFFNSDAYLRGLASFSKLKIKSGHISQLNVLNQIIVVNQGVEFLSTMSFKALIKGEDANSPDLSIVGGIRAAASLSPGVAAFVGSDALLSIKGMAQTLAFLELLQFTFNLQHYGSGTVENILVNVGSAVFLSDGGSFNTFQRRFTILDYYRGTTVGALEQLVLLETNLV